MNAADRQESLVDSNMGNGPEQAGQSGLKKNGRTGARDGRARFYGFLLLFIVVAGLPIAAVSGLRNRLLDRARAIYTAYTGDTGPVTAELDAPQPPYPEEYKRPPSTFPNPGQGIPEDWIFKSAAKKFGGQPDSPLALITPKTAEKKTESGGSGGEGAPEDAGSAAFGSDAADMFVQGEAEQNAYDLVLKSYPKVAGMVRGDDASLKFVSWGGMKRDGDEYWVRLQFETGEGREEEYIWAVDLKSKKVSPLSYNARSIS